MRYYEDLELGSVSSGTLTYLVTEEEILEIGRRFDPQPFHTDPDAAAESLFGGLVASSVHLFGITVKIGMDEFEVAAASNLATTNLVNHSPARPGDLLRMESTVMDCRASKSRPGMGVVTFRTLLRNQRDEAVFSYDTVALIHCRP